MTTPVQDAAHTSDSQERIVWMETSDGVPLEGVLITPGNASTPSWIVVWIHGSASHFFEPAFVRIGRALAGRGISFLAGNTRGHDGMSVLWRGDEPMAAGAAFERFDQSDHDLAAWIDFSRHHHAGPLALAGHSLGACKVINFASRSDSDIDALVVASPPPAWPSNPERLELARQMVAAGEAERLLPQLPGSAPWNLVSAQTVVTREECLMPSLYPEAGPSRLSQVRCPILVLIGGEEDVPLGWLRDRQQDAPSAAGVTPMTVEGAGHFYEGREAHAAAEIARWLEGLTG